MEGFAKAILIAILAVAGILVLFNMAFFFPWYMEVVETTFQVSQMVATDNYLTYDNYHEVYDTLCDKPIFEERQGDIKIEVKTRNESKDVIEWDSPRDVNDYYDLPNEEDKPYVQMGNLVDITISASYPFRMEMAGKVYTAADIPVSFTMTTTTVHHYKDLPYNYGVDGPSLGDDFDD